MSNQTELITNFYSAFQKKDYEKMNACYAQDIIFNDPAFGILQGDEVRAMWKMLCKNAKDFSLTFSNIQLLDEEYATCNWIAHYSFSKTGRKVVNNVKAHMRIEAGLITEQTDQFNIWTWSRQALGLPGVILGWSNYMKSKIQKNARKSLGQFMDKEDQINN